MPAAKLSTSGRPAGDSAATKPKAYFISVTTTKDPNGAVGFILRRRSMGRWEALDRMEVSATVDRNVPLPLRVGTVRPHRHCIANAIDR